MPACAAKPNDYGIMKASIGQGGLEQRIANRLGALCGRVGAAGFFPWKTTHLRMKPASAYWI
jgi:hypothetical protein